MISHRLVDVDDTCPLLSLHGFSKRLIPSFFPSLLGFVTRQGNAPSFLIKPRKIRDFPTITGLEDLVEIVAVV